MKTLYLECGMGAAGDMLGAALLELHPDREGFLQKLAGIGLPDVTVEALDATQCGIRGTRLKVIVSGTEEGEEHDHGHDHHSPHDHAHSHAEHDHDGEHHHPHDHSGGHDHPHDHDHGDHHPHDHSHHHVHRSLEDIEAIIRGLAIDASVKEDVLAVYRLLAEAESSAHGAPVAEIHFHEVGTMDAIADITAVCLLLHELSPDRVMASPIATGYGAVRCAHGILPVPAPATAHLLEGLPAYAGDVEGELCTPTGAALLKHFVREFGAMPRMLLEKTGYGMGKKSFPKANCVRAFWGEEFSGEAAPLAVAKTACAVAKSGETEVRDCPVVELSCNVDDMTGEEMGFATEELFAAGAVEVFTTPVYMKKNRPGILLTVLAPEEQKEAVLQTLFAHTTTIGVREQAVIRHVLDRREETVRTSLGDVRRKVTSGFGVEKQKWEYEDLARLAREQKTPLRELKKTLETEAE